VQDPQEVKDREWTAAIDGQENIRGTFTGTWRNSQPLDGTWVVPGFGSYEGPWRNGRFDGAGSLKVAEYK